MSRLRSNPRRTGGFIDILKPRRPPISVITPTLNAEAFLEACLASVEALRDDGIEHIVVDGGSTDRTLTILAAHPHVRILRQDGEGLYGALNEGLAAASGPYALLLNADDLLLPGAVGARRRAGGSMCSADPSGMSMQRARIRRRSPSMVPGCRRRSSASEPQL